MSGVPGTWADAQAATNGLFEVNFLPTINWDPDYTSSGVYFYRLEAPNFSAVNKMVMMK